MSDKLPWMAAARSQLGQTEVAGQKHNPRILAYHAVTKLKATSDEVPWCASFVGWCLDQANLPHTLSAAAISYADYGSPLAEPIEGCIAVFRRTGGNHVAFFVRKDETGRIWVLGGNQGNAVTIAPYRASDLIGYRWPPAPLPVTAPTPVKEAPKRSWLSRLFGR